MTKTELQVALAEATPTDKKTAGALLTALRMIAYKAVKKEGEFALPGFGKLVKQKRAARTGFNPRTRQKVKVAAKTVVKFRVAKGAKDAILGAKVLPDAGPQKGKPTPSASRARGNAGAPRPASTNAKRLATRPPVQAANRDQAPPVRRITPAKVSPARTPVKAPRRGKGG
ncbi:MAG TPA: HU family DNA-binding protein [Chthoniobacterales bacterium]